MSKFQPKKDYLLLKAVGRTNKNGIVIPFNPKGQTSNTRRMMIDNIEILAVGEEIKNLKVGDSVIPQGFVFNQIIPPENICEKEADNVQYYWAKEEHIIGVVNK